MAEYFDRYGKFKSNGKVALIPGLKIPGVVSDKTIVYKLGETRLDILSQKYYNSPYYGWLIMLANPRYGGLEFDIKDRDVIRVPYPLNNGIERYLNSVRIYKELYGE